MRPLQIQFHGLSERQRFDLRVRKREGGCWEWTGSLNNGYGQFRDAETGRPVLAHRKAWIFANGAIADGLGVLHKCDNPKCVNPDHLFLGDQMANVKDMHEKGRAKKRGLKGEEHWRSVVTEEAVREIRSSNKTARELAELFGLARNTVYDIRHRKTWQHVT